MFVRDRLWHWLRTTCICWRRRPTTVATAASGQRRPRRWLILMVMLGISGSVAQRKIGADHARPVELGLSLPEQAFADAVTLSPARTEPEAEATTPVTAATPAASTTSVSDLAVRMSVPALPITESAVHTTIPEMCISRRQRSVSSNRHTDATTAPRRPAGRVRLSRHRVARLAPPRDIAVVAVASRSALLRLPHGPLVTVQSGTILQGWTVDRFSPSGIVLTHHDQRTLVPISLEMGHTH